ncbi:MAG: HlyD family efflux transporter periplasmic adaptor subunit [Chloroflexi bacterium]|nr:HlyD family efflux transporter periplasmic adaptor subunit [Chloroflexota bacterium]
MKIRSTLAVLLSSMLLFTACVPSLPFISGDGEEEVVVARPVTSLERPTVKVERGSIIDAVRVLGRVVAESEESLFFKQNGRLKGIYVQYNQEVVQGTLLADLETGDLETQIQNSELSLQDTERNLITARTQAATGQADVTLAKIAVEQAERDLEDAREALVEAQGGPTALEFAQAQTTYTKAAADVMAAENALKIAERAFKQAEKDLIDFLSGAPVDLKVQRELALSQAEEAVRTAQTQVDQVQSGNPETQVLGQESTLRGRQEALERANQAINAERDKVKARITEVLDNYRKYLSEIVVEIEEELDEVFDAIKQLGRKAPGARDAFERLLKELDVAQDNFSDAMDLKLDVPERQRAEHQRGLEAFLDQLNLGAIAAVLESDAEPGESDEEAQTLAEDLVGAALAREALDIVQMALLQAKAAGSSLSSTRARLEEAQEKLDEYIEQRAEDEVKIQELSAQLFAPPPPGTEMAILWKSQERARLDLQAAELALDQGKAQASESVSVAQSGLDRARFELEQAQAAIDNIHEDLDSLFVSAELNYNAAQAAVNKAKADLDIAKEAWDIVQSGLDPEKVRNAEISVASKEAALIKAQAAHEQALINASDAGNVTKLENDLKRARANHELLLERLEDARLVAPFDGVIQFISGKAGEPVSAYGPIIGLADPTILIVTADLSEDDTPKVALDQVADLTLDAFPSVVLKGIITKLPTSLVTTQGVIQDRSIRMDVNWPQAGAEIGMLARVTITVQHKDDVLKVPIESVKRSGRRTFVEFMDGDIKRAKNVEIGIQTETEVEILSGLEEGFVILQGQ